MVSSCRAGWRASRWARCPLAVKGEVVAGTLRTPEATYRIRPAGKGLHAVSQVDLSQLPPLERAYPAAGVGARRAATRGPDSGQAAGSALHDCTG